MKSPTLKSSDVLLPAPDGLLARPGRAALPASAPGASVRRRAGARAPTHHRHLAARLAAALGALGSGRTGAGRERGRALPAGRGSACPLSGGAAAVDRCGACGAPAHAFRGEAVPGPQFDSRERLAAVRCRHRVGVPAAQLGARRGAADRLRLCRRCPDRLAPVHGARHGHVVRGADRRGLAALAQRGCGLAT